MKHKQLKKHHYARGYSVLLIAIGVGSAIAAHAAQAAVIEGFLASRNFGLADIYGAGSRASTLGAIATLALLGWFTRKRFDRLVQVQAIIYLQDALGRESFPVDYRAAIAYVLQELTGEVNK